MTDVLTTGPDAATAMAGAAQLDAWSAGAVTAGDHELVAVLRAADPDAAVLRARADVLSGRPGAARAALRGAGHAVAVPPADWAGLVDLAAVAALGTDASALPRLLAAGSSLHGQAAREWVWLVGAAAEQRAEHELADQAWRALVREHGVRSTPVLVRLLVAVLSARPAGDVAGVAEAARVAAEVVAETDLTVAERVRMVAEGAARLSARDDAPGAALLVAATARRVPDRAAWAAVVARWVPATPWTLVLGPLAGPLLGHRDADERALGRLRPGTRGPRLPVADPVGLLAGDDDAALVCTCWERSVLDGVSAQAYAARHLRPARVVLGPAVEGAAALAGLVVRAVRCPVTARVWLAVARDGEPVRLLLDGPPSEPLPAAPSSAPAAPAAVPTPHAASDDATGRPTRPAPAGTDGGTLPGGYL
ncbi:hypothetical protein [Cellulomonas marina]|uniref:hypothetical protein n=1 Tax=Cellulomonas marina TaxID=988821 RepID=UPI000B7EEE82|nr:hypothetical protein [Cellulomonas marina]